MQLTVSEKEEILQNNLDYTIFSWSKQSGLNPLNIKGAKGVWLFERSGKKILDFSSQLMNMNIGHGHPRVKEAVMRQMDEVSFVHPGMITEARGTLGKKLAEITPGSLRKTFCIVFGDALPGLFSRFISASCVFTPLANLASSSTGPGS